MTETTGLTGGCQCGAVRYRLRAAPRWSNVCHCRMCQKASGSPFMAFVSVAADELEWTRGAPRTFASSAIAERGFCADCGTPLTYQGFGRPNISVTSGSLDRPEAAAPTEQLGIEARLSWLDLLPGLPAVNTGEWLATRNLTDAGSRQHPDSET